MQSNSLKNKVIVITGGAGAIGQSFVRGVSDRGGIAIVADINLEASELIAQDCTGNAYAAHLDITSKESVIALISDLKQRYGHIDALVNNAYPRNKNYGKKLEDVTYADFCDNVNMV
jgi:NAD(P)-dependent dehydrogenase (short-subunit alcohol dehydrogenase family)